jgi:hypothetical protein
MASPGMAGLVTFLNPAAFGVLAAFMAGLIALYMIRMRRKDLVVPASFLWPERTDEIRANSLFQKLKFSWLLVLQLLALTLIGFSWARPQMRQQGLAGSITVVVLDGSASMGAKEEATTRFEVAKNSLLSMIDAARPGDRLALILAGPEPKVVFPLTNDPGRQKQTVKGLQGTDADADVGEALRLAAALAGGTNGAKIVLLSDGVFEPVENFSPGKAQALYSRIGKSTENLAIQAFGFGAGKLYISVRNYGKSEGKATVTVKADGEAVDSENVTVAAGKTWSKTLAPPAGKKVFEGFIETDDALASDNYAAVIADPASSLRVLLITRGDLFLERALALEPRVTVDKGSAVPPNEQAGSDGPGIYDLVIFDGVEEEAVKARGVLTLGTPGSSSPVSDQGTLSMPEYLDATDHPLNEGVNFSEIYIEKGRKVSPRGAARTIVESRQGPLVVAKDGTQRQIFVAFQPLESDFPLTVSFPIFLANTLDWLGGQTGGENAVIKPGQAFALATERAVARRKDFEREFKGRQGRTIVRGLDRVGDYEVSWQGGKRRIYVQMRSESESQIEPEKEVRLGGDPVQGTAPVERLSDMWKPLALMMLLVLAGEWFLFMRRS